jgi:2-dehydropantoate 2-reductase
MRNLKLLILGAGGVGGYFGGRLIQSGTDVSFLVRPGRAAQLAADGLQVESPHGNFQVTAKAITADQLHGDWDLIVLSPKAYDLDDAIETLRPAMAQTACLLPLLNGVAHMDQLDATFGAHRVLGGVAHIAATLSKAGVVRQLNPLHILTMGHREPAQATLARAFFEACKAANFDAIYSEDITQTLWDKWTFLATLAGSTTLFRSGVGAVTAKPEGAALMTRMYGECLAVATAFGQPVGEAAQDKARGILMAPGSDFTASMLRDLLGDQRTEHEHILGDMARRATAKGIDAPLITAAYIHMVAETSGAPRAA